MASKLEFTRGDTKTHTFTIEATLWSAGGTLFFAAKPAIDDDLTDAAATITGEFTDDDVSNVTIDGVAYKRYTCVFPASATTSIASNGAKKAKYLGEFQHVPVGGQPKTYPENDKKLDVILYFDVKRGTS
jgi:hypothetical protein